MQLVQVSLPVLVTLLLILLILGEKVLAYLTLLGAGMQLELQRANLPDVEDAQHAFAHLPRHPRKSCI